MMMIIRIFNTLFCKLTGTNEFQRRSLLPIAGNPTLASAARMLHYMPV
jgi:hypothetical protein